MNEISIYQQALCQRIGSSFDPPLPLQKLGVAIESLNQTPIYGVRVESEYDTCGWYIWCGPRSDSPDFFSPVHTSHIPDLCPSVLPYLGLPSGYRFIIDRNGYEDVWFEGAE